MKNIIINCILAIAKIVLKIIYFFIKLCTKQKNKIVMLSRQSNEPSLDFNLIIQEIEKQNETLKIVVLCKKIPKSFIKKITYCLYNIKILYELATSKICIIDGYIIPVSILKHKKNLKIIQIWHAMGAIKQFGWQVIQKSEGSKEAIAKIMKMHQNYTNVICTSNSTKAFYEKAFNIEKEKILVLGIPKIDYLLGKNGTIKEKTKEIENEYSYLKEKPTILYVPTFRKNENVHVYKIIEAVNKEKYNLIIRLHPLDNTKIDEKYKINEKYKTIDLLNVADYIITDYSAIAFEACVLNKKVFFYLYDINKYKENRGLNVNLVEEMKSSTSQNIENIINIIENDEYNYKEMQKFKEKYIQTLDTNNTQRIVEYILSLMN